MTAPTEQLVGPECSAPEEAKVSLPRASRGYASGKDDYLARLKKIEGQVRGLQKMIADDRWCPHIVTQVASATRALQEVAVGLLNDHLHHCVMAAARSSDAGGQARLDEVAATIRQVVRL
ncbi:MAG: metal-sensitive transcriptional regulator [Actinomycetota bacterium]|jgi:DNA-binding FrmR family transcriptional regulator|nr:metal-sensitive transcriptional regulator [Actinomycetota bacterium]